MQNWNEKFILILDKEHNTETDYTYFGARYYDSDLSSWLSVDPLSDKYPSLSPYNYCAGNPVVLVDPDGRSIDDYKLIKATGQIKLIRKTNDSFDRVYAQDGSKFDLENPLVLKKGILGKKPSGNILGDAYVSSDEKELDKLYTFVGKNPRSLGFVIRVLLSI